MQEAVTAFQNHRIIFRQWRLPGYRGLYSIRCSSSVWVPLLVCLTVYSGVGQALLPGSALLILWLYFQVQTDQTRPGGEPVFDTRFISKVVHIYKQTSKQGYRNNIMKYSEFAILYCCTEFVGSILKLRLYF